MNTTPSSTLHFTSTTASDGIAERTFTLGDIGGVLWSPESATDGGPLMATAAPAQVGPGPSGPAGRG